MVTLANLNFNRKLGTFGRMLGKSSVKPKRPLVFQSLLNGEDITLDVCSFEEILPYSLLSIPVSTITPNDSVWIATSMLSRISEQRDRKSVVRERV